MRWTWQRMCPALRDRKGVKGVLRDPRVSEPRDLSESPDEWKTTGGPKR